MQEARVWSLGQEDPWRREWLPTPVFLPGESQGQKSLAGYSPRGHKRVRHDLATNNELLKTYVIPNVFEVVYKIKLGLPGGAGSKEPACQCRLDVRDLGSIPGSGISFGRRHSHPIPYSYLENPMDRGAWQGAVRGVAQSWTRLK